MVDPQWRSLRPPKQVLPNFTNIHNRYVLNQKYFNYYRPNLQVNRVNYNDFDSQGYVDHNDVEIFKEDSVVDIQFPEMKPKFLMGDRRIHYDKWIHLFNKVQHLNASNEPANTHNCNIEDGSKFGQARNSSTTVLTSDCPNEENDVKPILVPTQDSIETHTGHSELLKGSMSSLATTSLMCEVNTADSLSSHFNDVPFKIRDQIEAQRRRALKRKRHRLNKKRNKVDKDHVYIQCRLSKKLLTEIIKSSISVHENRLCL